MKALSTELPHPRHPRTCQACGIVAAEADELTRWIECDERDKPQRVIIVLCKTCSKRLIEKHERLYAEIITYRPIHGTLDLCVDCTYRRELDCTHPDLKANGGSGLVLKGPAKDHAHVCYSGKGGRRGEWITLYRGPATACPGRRTTGGEKDG